MKATGKQWNDFLASWPDEWWYDDDDLLVDGKEETEEGIRPGARIDLTCGVLYQGRDHGAPDLDLVRAFRKWIKEQNYDTVIVQVPKTVDAHHFASRVLEMFGAKVVKP